MGLLRWRLATCGQADPDQKTSAAGKEYFPLWL